jgi:glycosyltransferase involved in cell wall biosynthesis
MTRILVCGLCPLPWESTQKSYGPGIRTWQFAWSLANAGHSVRLVAMRIDDAYAGSHPVASETRERVEIRRFAMAEVLNGGVVKDEISRWRPDALVGATIYGSYSIARWKPEQPFWADEFGHVMAEAQAKAALDGNNNVLPYFWRMVRPVIAWADKISAVSHRQRYAAIGELGWAGRLGYETSGYEFVSVIPCAQPPQEVTYSRDRSSEDGLPDDAFVVLWSGGYNVWSDVRTLFAGLERAMRENPRIHFLSTGGVIPDHDELTYRTFVELVEQSDLRNRFHLKGWVPADDVIGYWNRSDLGVLTELKMYEGELGDKNRVVQWLGFGLPVAYNRIGDLGDLLAANEIGLVFDQGDSDGLADRILWAADHPEKLRSMSHDGRRLVEAQLSFEESTRDLLQWATKPLLAPDAPHKGTFQHPDHEASIIRRVYTSGGWIDRLLIATGTKEIVRAIFKR